MYIQISFMHVSAKHSQIIKGKAIWSKHGEGVFVICVFETGNNQTNSSCEHHSIEICKNV